MREVFWGDKTAAGVTSLQKMAKSKQMFTILYELCD